MEIFKSSKDHSFYAKLIMLLAGLGLGAMGLYFREVEPSGAQTPIDTVSNFDPLGNSSQRKVWFDGTKYWTAFFSEGDSRIEFWYSVDGNSWNENVGARITSDSSDFTVKADNEAAYIIYSYEGSVYARKNLDIGALILRPDGEGSETSIPYSEPSDHWDAVNEEVQDDFGTYLYNWELTSRRDLFTASDPVIQSGTITGVRVYFTCYDQVEALYSAAIGVSGNSANGTDILSNENSDTGMTEYYQEWTLNPFGFTAAPWEWNDIVNLEIGVAMNPDPDYGAAACTQIYALVNFTPDMYPDPNFNWEDPILIAEYGAQYTTVETFIDEAGISPEGDTSYNSVDTKHVVGDIFILVTRNGTATKCILSTFRIDPEGDIITPIIDDEAIETTSCQSPRIAHIEGDVWALVYRKSGAGNIRTFTVDSSGLIGSSYISEYQFAVSTFEPNIVNITEDTTDIADNVVMIAYNNGNGSLITLSIDSSGIINPTPLSSIIFYSGGETDTDFTRLNQGVYMLDFRHIGHRVVTVQFDSWGVISTTILDSLQFEGTTTLSNSLNSVIDVGPDTYAIFYTDNTGIGHVATFTADSLGNIGDSTINEEIYSSYGTYPTLSKLPDNYYVVTHQGPGGGVNYFTVLNISGTGSIASEILENFNTGYSGGALRHLSLSSGYYFIIQNRNSDIHIYTYRSRLSPQEYSGNSVDVDDDGIWVTTIKDFESSTGLLIKNSDPSSLSGFSQSTISSSSLMPGGVSKIVSLDLGNAYGFFRNGTALSGRRFNGSGWEGSTTLDTLGSENSFSVVKGEGETLHLTYVNDTGRVAYKYFNGTAWSSSPIILDPAGNNLTTTLTYDGSREYIYAFWANSSGTLRYSVGRLSGGSFEWSVASNIAGAVENVISQEYSSGGAEALMLIWSGASGPSYSVNSYLFDISDDPFPPPPAGDDGSDDGGPIIVPPSDGSSTGTGGGNETDAGGDDAGGGDDGEDDEEDGGNVVPPTGDGGSSDGSIGGDVGGEGDDPAKRDQIQEIISDTASGVSQTALVTTTVTSTIALVALVGGFLNEIPSVLLRWVLALLSFFRLRKKGNPIGFVYNSVTKDPIGGAIVRIYDNKGHLVRTDVTNYVGVFYAEVDAGKYKIVVSKSGFRFPSQIVRGGSDNEIRNLYHGDLLEVKKQGELSYSIPLDPVNSSNTFDIMQSLIRNRLSKIISNFLNLLVIFGLSSSLVALLVDRSSQNFIILLVYIYASFISYLSHIVSGAARYGTLKSKGGVPVEGVVVGLRDLKSDEIISRRVSDENGQYRFLANSGEYRIEIVDDGFAMSNPNDLNNRIVVHKDRAVIKVDFTIKRRR